MFREIEDLGALKIFAAEIASECTGPRHLILLDGPMGSGKTQFTRYLVEAMGSSEVTSPSFAIHNRYATARGPVEHVDLYRIDSKDDLESTGFWDLFLETEGIVILEWSDRLKDWGVFTHLPRNWPRLKLRFDLPVAEIGLKAAPRSERRQVLVQRSQTVR